MPKKKKTTNTKQYHSTPKQLENDEQDWEIPPDNVEESEYEDDEDLDQVKLAEGEEALFMDNLEDDDSMDENENLEDGNDEDNGGEDGSGKNGSEKFLSDDFLEKLMQEEKQTLRAALKKPRKEKKTEKTREI